MFETKTIHIYTNQGTLTFTGVTNYLTTRDAQSETTETTIEFSSNEGTHSFVLRNIIGYTIVREK